MASDRTTNAATSRRILVIATVEVPTDNVPTEDQLNADVRQALTSAGYLVVRANSEPIIPDPVVDAFDREFVPNCDTEGL